MGISTHVLDTARGRPAPGVAVTLDRLEDFGWSVLRTSVTDLDGRVPAMLSRDRAPTPGVYRLRFATAEYFATEGVAGLYPTVEISFVVRAGDRHCHIPLLLAANTYTTYRGS